MLPSSGGGGADLATGLGPAIANAIRLLDGLAAAGLAVEVTHRSKRRLFGPYLENSPGRPR
jgi:hypothetical protein